MFFVERTEHPRSLKFVLGRTITMWRRVATDDNFDSAKVVCDEFNLKDDGFFRVTRMYDSEVMYEPTKQHEVKFQKKNTQNNKKYLKLKK